jgi:hypothetical protein
MELGGVDDGSCFERRNGKEDLASGGVVDSGSNDKHGK